MEPSAELADTAEYPFVEEVTPVSARPRSAVVAAVWPIYATAGVAGFAMMGLEILAGPLLEPAFGNGNDLWAGIISVFILSLSVGYLLGGRVADRNPKLGLSAALMTAGLCYTLLPVFAWDLVDWMVAVVPRMRVGALVAALLLFFVPSLLVGMVSPMLVKLAFVGVDRLGRTTGVIYATGAVGNVLGVLVTNFFLVDRFGVASTLFALGLALLLAGVWHTATQAQTSAR